MKILKIENKAKKITVIVKGKRNAVLEYITYIHSW